MKLFLEEYGGILFVIVLTIVIVRLFATILTKSADGSLQADPGNALT